MFTYQTINGVPEGELASQIQSLLDTVLPSHTGVDLADRLSHARDPWGVVAVHDGRVVGVKLGYSDRPGRFYSWLGGVAPEHRRQGVASELLRRQHARCLAEGYTRVRTTTTNARRAMLLLNLRAGFDIVGTTQSRGRELTIVMERWLV